MTESENQIRYPDQVRNEMEHFEPDTVSKEEFTLIVNLCTFYQQAFSSGLEWILRLQSLFSNPNRCLKNDSR